MISRQLFQLQELDLEIESRQRSRDELSHGLGESAELQNARASIVAAQGRFEALKKEQKSLEWEIDDLSAKTKTVHDRLYGGRVSNPKELASLQQEEQSFKATCSQREDRALEVMSEIDTLSAAIAEKQASLQNIEAEWRAAQGKMKGEIDRLQKSLDELEAKRKSLASQIKPDLLAFYQSLRQQKGTAVARVEQGRCSGCRILLAVTEIQRSRNSLVQCSSCGRILYVP